MQLKTLDSLKYFGVFRAGVLGAKYLSPEGKFYTNSKLIGRHDLYHPGMLDDLNASTFRGSRYSSYFLKKDTVLYRSGSHEEPLGQFFTFDIPISELQTRIDKAVLPKWPNSSSSIIDTGYAVKLPKGTAVHVGEVAQQNDIFLGGSNQIFVEKPWIIHGVKVINVFSLKEELIWNQVAMTK